MFDWIGLIDFKREQKGLCNTINTIRHSNHYFSEYVLVWIDGQKLKVRTPVLTQFHFLIQQYYFILWPQSQTWGSNQMNRGTYFEEHFTKLMIKISLITVHNYNGSQSYKYIVAWAEHCQIVRMFTFAPK